MLVDDSRLVRSSLRDRLSLEEDLVVVAEARDGMEAIKLACTSLTEINVLIMDYEMPLCGGIEACRHLKRLKPEVAVIILSGLSNQEVQRRAAQAGADLFLVKGAIGPRLIEAVRQLGRNSSAFEPRSN